MQRAMALKPQLPDWVYLPYFYNYYRKGEYQTALQVAKKINMPEDPWPQMGIAASLRRHQSLYLDLKY